MCVNCNLALPLKPETAAALRVAACQPMSAREVCEHAAALIDGHHGSIEDRASALAACIPGMSALSSPRAVHLADAMRAREAAEGAPPGTYVKKAYKHLVWLMSDHSAFHDPSLAEANFTNMNQWEPTGDGARLRKKSPLPPPAREDALADGFPRTQVCYQSAGHTNMLLADPALGHEILQAIFAQERSGWKAEDEMIRNLPEDVFWQLVARTCV